VKPTCLVSFPRQSVLLQGYVHVVGHVSVVFMRGKCVEAIDSDRVLENCAICLVFLQEKKTQRNLDPFKIRKSRGAKLMLYT